MIVDAVSLGFGIVVFLAMGASHVAAGNDPYRNFMTQLVFGWYEAHSPYEGAALQRLLRFGGIAYFALAAVLAAIFGFQLLA